jgi:hypothetical protein
MARVFILIIPMPAGVVAVGRVSQYKKSYIIKKAS